MSITKDKASGCWQFEFSRRINGKRIRTRKLLPKGTTRAQADAYDRQESATLYAIASGAGRRQRTVDEAVTAYIAERIPELKAGANCQRELESLHDWYTGRPIEDLPAICLEYQEDQKGTLQPATIKNRLSYLRAACRFAWKRHNMCLADPGARVEMPTVRNERQLYIKRDLMVRLARACRHRGVRALIRIAFYSGMRVSEIQRAERRGEDFVLADTKNGEPRVVPIHPKAASAARVTPPKRSEIDYYWPLAREACGVPELHLHDLRHSTASGILAAGYGLAAVGAVLGHKSAASSRRYAHLDVSYQRSVLNALGKKAG